MRRSTLHRDWRGEREDEGRRRLQEEFSVIGPLPSFVIQTGGSIGVIALLPRNTGIVTAEALTGPNNPGVAFT